MKALRIFAFWVVLVVVFVVFFQYFSRPGASTEGAVPLVAAIGALVALVTLIVVLVRARKGIRLLNEGVVLLNQGRAAAALDLFEKARPTLSRSPLVPYNIACAHLVLWRTAAADREFDAMKRVMWLGPGLKPMVAGARFFIAALEGRRTDAQGWLESLRGTPSEHSPTVLLGQVVLAAREARWSDAITLLHRHELKSLGGTLRAMSEALLSWAETEMGRPARPVDRVALLGEAGSDALRDVWPELVTFVSAAPGR